MGSVWDRPVPGVDLQALTPTGPRDLSDGVEARVVQHLAPREVDDHLGLGRALGLYPGLEAHRGAEEEGTAEAEDAGALALGLVEEADLPGGRPGEGEGADEEAREDGRGQVDGDGHTCAETAAGTDACNCRHRCLQLRATTAQLVQLVPMPRPVPNAWPSPHHFQQPHLTVSHLSPTSLHIASTQLTQILIFSPHFTEPHPTSPQQPHLTSPRLDSPRVASPHLKDPRCTSHHLG